MKTEETDACAACGRSFPLHLLDSKPTRLAGPIIINADEFYSELCNALDANEELDRLECEACYGPGWAEGVPCYHDT
jgi:hypothetical protein